jgi:excisionase family DNA binding protein
MIPPRMTVREAAAHLGLGATSVRQLVAAGTLTGRKVGPKGGRLVLDRAEVERYWDSRPVVTPPAPAAAPSPAAAGPARGLVPSRYFPPRPAPPPAASRRRGTPRSAP